MSGPNQKYTAESIATDLGSWRDKVAAILAQDVEEEAALRIRIARNKALLDSIDAAKSGYHPNGANVSSTPKRTGPRRRMGGKIDLVLRAIENLGASHFTSDDVFAEISRSFPKSDITRGDISGLLWRVLATKYGRGTLRQISTKRGGNLAIYEKINSPPVAPLRPANGTKPHLKI